MGSVGAKISGKMFPSKIDKVPFTNMGGGQWEVDIEGVGGGSILEVSESWKYGPGKAYEVRIWNDGYNTVDNGVYYATLNTAKSAIKDRLKEMYAQ